MKYPHEILKSTRVKKAVESLPVSIKTSDLATRARKIVRRTNLRSLPVTENGKLCGILRLRELLKIKSTHSNLKATGVMMPPTLTVTPDWSLARTAEKSIELDMPVAPVIKTRTDKTLLGVIRLENILKEIEEYCGENPKTRDIMTEEVLTTSPEDRISKVWNMMEESRISGIPVVKKDKPVGMITRLDILKSGKARLAIGSKRRQDSPKVKTIMKGPAITTSPDDPIKDPVKTMIKHNIGRLPVTEGEKLIGIVDREDMIRPYL